MNIKKAVIELFIEEKITKKHGVDREEIEHTLFEGHPIFFRTSKK